MCHRQQHGSKTRKSVRAAGARPVFRPLGIQLIRGVMRNPAVPAHGLDSGTGSRVVRCEALSTAKAETISSTEWLQDAQETHKNIRSLLHLLTQASAHLMQLPNPSTCKTEEKHDKREALPPPVPPSCSYCSRLSWPWALWAGRVPGPSHHILSGSQWKRLCTTHGWRGWRCNLHRLQQILP